MTKEKAPLQAESFQRLKHFLSKMCYTELNKQILETGTGQGNRVKITSGEATVRRAQLFAVRMPACVDQRFHSKQRVSFLIGRQPSLPRPFYLSGRNKGGIFMKVKKLLVFLLVLTTVVAMFCGCGKKKAKESEPAPEAAGKKITVTVIHADGTSKDFEYETNAENFGDVLREEKLAEGQESETGLFVTTVDGETADDSQQQWWKVSVNGEMAQKGVDETPVNDGDTFELALTTGW